MVSQPTLFLCPSCSCHARREERECPHCGAPLTREVGTATQRSVAAMAMGLALAVALPLAGCGGYVTQGGSGQGGEGAGRSGDTIGSGGNGGTIASPTGSGGSTSSDGGHGSSNSSSSQANQAVSAYGAPPSAGPGGGGGCLDEPLFFDPACDECAQDSCCPEIEACLADPANCFYADVTAPDPDTAAGAALASCLTGNCEAECGGPPSLCDTGLTFGDPEIDACFDPACCVEITACVDPGDQLCIDCISAYLEAGGANEPGAACADFVGCGEAEGCFG